MANIGTYDVQAPRREMKILTGQFTCNGSSAVASSTIKGDISSVTRDGAGLYTVTLKHSWKQVAGIFVSMKGTGDTWARVKTEDVDGGSLVIELWDVSAGAVTDSTADVIYICVLALNTGVGA